MGGLGIGVAKIIGTTGIILTSFRGLQLFMSKYSAAHLAKPTDKCH
jgi:hypothetical protein